MNAIGYIVLGATIIAQYLIVVAIPYYPLIFLPDYFGFPLVSAYLLGIGTHALVRRS